MLPAGGAVHAESSEIVVTEADSVTILIAAATDFKGGPFAGGDPEARCERDLAAAKTRSAIDLLSRQEACLPTGLPANDISSRRSIVRT